jgi:hypothetical protein
MEQDRAPVVLVHLDKLAGQAAPQLPHHFIAATTTDAGLKVRAELDESKYPKGVKVSDAELAAIRLKPHSFHGDWNYTIMAIVERLRSPKKK